jgi:F-type H+-transporting ATPase subunit gamma
MLYGEHSKLKRRTFKETCIFADNILRTEFDHGEFIYNNFKNMIAFDTTIVPFTNRTIALSDPTQFVIYEQEGNSDILENFYEFFIAVRLHSFLAETDMVEFSQRVNSMSNSSKNAEEMLSKLRLLYNRSRQAKITTELIEIISGATAAAEQVA